eukprot:TRINITY_DN15602_c0_g1_i1.p1 TRINITY_DN15602_c0_g1~~TRINITY_DN15602_c0_g1_i1.p1  ORF type:complete len:727 (-),score=300.30 TRINITY_DN15602_c0_g1_i1:176-2179(-)
MVQEANSGHPGAPMGCAPIAFELYTQFMSYSPSDPQWPGRDRFILSNGHACALQYIMLHLTGHSLSMDDLKSFRKVDSMTPGHPENFVTPGIEVSTGPLGQGLSNAVGLAIAEKHMAATYNKEGFDLVDNYTYVLCGDGCLQEGVTSEASSLAGHLGLGKLILLYDDNQITIDGETELSFTEDVLKRYEAYGWHTSSVADGTNLKDLNKKIEAARKVTNKPSIIKVTTVIGFGSVNQGKEKVHGAPLGADDVRQVKEKFGFDPDQSFVVPDDVRDVFTSCAEAGEQARKEWHAMLAKYKEAHPDLGAEFERRIAGKLPEGWADGLPVYKVGDAAKASRFTSGLALNALAAKLPEMVGGSADLTPSNLTALKETGDFQKDTPEGRYIRFGVREHGMAAISNGIFCYGGYRPFCATFLNFISYASGAVRLSALSRMGVLYIMTHDSIGLGEDGPTHQPIETLALCRATPNMHTWRPADGNEVSGAYYSAMESYNTPSVLALSRQNLPVLEGSSMEKVKKGGYVLKEYGEGDDLDIIIASTGSEVCICVDTAKLLAEAGKKVRIVSMPCLEIYDEQPEAYKLECFPEGVPVMSVEALGIEGWHKYAHAPFGLIRFGSSGKGPDVYKKFGITPDNLKVQAEKVIAFYPKGQAPSLVKRPQLDFVRYNEHGH